MYIEHLSLQNFRNYARLEVSLPAGPILLHGSNAQGKTSLLEAIYYLATSRSPYTTTDRQLINWNADRDLLSFAKIGAEVISAGRTLSRVEVTLVQEPGALNGSRLQKDIRINGVPRRVMDLIGKINVVMFLPQDLVLVEGSPAERRRYMNVTLCRTDPAYCEALATFEKALTQRNALLKRIGDGEARPEELAYWNEQLAQAGGVLVAGRQRLLRDLEVRARRVHRDLSGGEEDLELSYQPSFCRPPTTPASCPLRCWGWTQPPVESCRHRRAVRPHARRAARRGHRARHDPDRPAARRVRLLVNTRDLGLYGSRGQARTAVMSLKLAELEWMRDTVGEWPILLLDEVIAELTAARRAYLLERISGAEQVLLTTTEPDIFTPEFLSKATRWRIRQGQIVDAS